MVLLHSATHMPATSFALAKTTSSQLFPVHHFLYCSTIDDFIYLRESVVQKNHQRVPVPMLANMIHVPTSATTTVMR